MHARSMLDWVVGRLSWLLLQTRIGQVLAAHMLIGGAGASPFFEYHENTDDYFDYNFFQDYSQPKRRMKRKKPPAPEDEGGEVFPRKPKENETRTDWLPCDRKITLYGLNYRQDEISSEDDEEDDVEEEEPTPECSVTRPSQVSRIPHSNLLLVVVDTAYPSCYVKFSTKPEEINIDDPFKENYHCHKLALGNLTRRRMTGCFSHHYDEREIYTCGRGPTISANKRGIFLSLLTLVLARLCA